MPHREKPQRLGAKGLPRSWKAKAARTKRKGKPKGLEPRIVLSSNLPPTAKDGKRTQFFTREVIMGHSIHGFTKE